MFLKYRQACPATQFGNPTTENVLMCSSGGHYLMSSPTTSGYLDTLPT